MGRSIGIDLGTTNTAVAVVVDGRPRVLEDEKGYKVLPSCVSAKGNGRYVIGQAARSLILSQPDSTVYAIKRLVGRRFDSPEVARARQRVSYKLERAEDGGVLVRMGDETFTPVELSSIVLKVAGQIAERALGESVSEAVITVPAYFTHVQREATFEAARMAGLHCERLINEPTAAALAYGHRKDLDRQLLVFDLGGGTFDVCVLRVTGGVYEILATSGDSFLGGEDFDYRLVDHLVEHFKVKHGHDVREDRLALQRLKEAAERAKCELSFTDRTTVLVPRLVEDVNLEMVVSRTTMESLVEDLVARTMETTQRTIADAGSTMGQVDDIVLVGGQTRMPRIRETITSIFGREPNRSVHPEEVVAVGAAVHAASLEETAPARHVLLDVTPFDLGIDSVGGMFAPIIPRNSKIPVSRTRSFATIHDNQDRVRLVVRQGENLRADDNEFLGQFVMGGITPMPRMEAKVKVTFRLDANGMLHVQAVEAATGERKQITIRNYAEVVSEHGAVKPDLEGDLGADRVPPAARSLSSSGGAQLGGDNGAAGGLMGFLNRFFGKGGEEQRDSAPVVASGQPAADPGAGDSSIKGVQIVADDMVPPAEGASTGPDKPDRLVPTDMSEDGMLLPLGEEEEMDDYGVEGLFGDPSSPAAVGIAGESLEAGQFQSRQVIDRSSSETVQDGPWVCQEDEDDSPVDDFLDYDDVPEALAGEAVEDLPDEDLQEGSDSGAISGDPFLDDAIFSGQLEPLDLDEAGPEFLEALPDDDGEVDLFTGEAPLPVSPAPADDDEEEVTDEALETEPPVAEAVAAASPAPPEPGKRAPARLKMSYRSLPAFLREYRENMRRGGTFIKTQKPLPVGRECLFEIRAPGLDGALEFPGLVTWSSAGQAQASGQEPGMGVEYRMDEETRARVEAELNRLKRL